jgi:hypothetical protein
MTPPNSCTSAFCVLTIIITIILFSLPVDAIAAQSAIGLFYLQFDDSYRCLDCTVYALDSLAAWYSDRDIPWVDTVLVEPDLDNSPEITIDELIYCIGPKLLAYRDLVVIHSHGIGGPPEFCGGFAAEYYLNWAMCDYKIGVRQTQCNLPEGYLQLCEVKQRELGEWVHVAWAICLSADCIRDYITPDLHDDCGVIAACCSSLCGANAWYKCKEMLGYAEEEDLLKGCADIHTALGHLACDDPAIPNTLEGAMEGTNFGRAELG